MTTTDNYMSTESLTADLNHTGAPGPANQARHLLRLDTPARRARASREGYTLGNLRPGGRPSDDTGQAVDALLRMIAAGVEDEEMTGERTARIYREKDNARRDAERESAIAYWAKVNAQPQV